MTMDAICAVPSTKGIMIQLIGCEGVGVQVGHVGLAPQWRGTLIMSRTMVREVVPTIFDVNGLHGEIINNCSNYTW